jgi:hypothetical protein
MAIEVEISFIFLFTIMSVRAIDKTEFKDIRNLEILNPSLLNTLITYFFLIIVNPYFLIKLFILNLISIIFVFFVINENNKELVEFYLIVITSLLMPLLYIIYTLMKIATVLMFIFTLIVVIFY